MKSPLSPLHIHFCWKMPCPFPLLTWSHSTWTLWSVFFCRTGTFRPPLIYLLVVTCSKNIFSFSSHPWLPWLFEGALTHLQGAGCLCSLPVTEIYSPVCPPLSYLPHSCSIYGATHPPAHLSALSQVASHYLLCFPYLELIKHLVWFGLYGLRVRLVAAQIVMWLSFT